VSDHRIVSTEQPALVFVNPAAGGGKGIAWLPRIKRVFEEARVPAEFVQTTAAREMAELARKAVTAGRKLLIVMGGDGTLQELVNAGRGADVVVGVIPVGGGNDFAAALRLPKNPIEATRAMLSGEPRWVDLLQARTANGQERLYVGGGGVGLDAEAAQFAATIFRETPGRLRYIFSALKALRHFKPLKVTATFPGSELPDVQSSVLLVAALNTPTYGAGLRLAPEATLDDGCFDVVLVQNLHWNEVLRLLPGLFLTGELGTSRVTRVRAKRVQLATDRPCIFHADGELLGGAPVTIEVIPNAIRVLAPLVFAADSK
jgi:diacylglycerol kinase (ATP)